MAHRKHCEPVLHDGDSVFKDALHDIDSGQYGEVLETFQKY